MQSSVPSNFAYLHLVDVSCPKPGTALEVDAISVGRKVVGHGDYAFSVNAPWQNQRYCAMYQ